MVFRVTRISAKNFKRLDKVDVEIDIARAEVDGREYEVNKLLLFGPNGGGKSSLITAFFALLSQLSGKYDEVLVDIFGSPQSLIRFGAERAEIEAAINGKTYRLLIDEWSTSLYEVGEAGEVKLSHGVMPISVGILQPCALYSSVDTPYEGRIGKLELCPPAIMVRDPDLAEWIESNKFLAGIDDIYGERVKIDGHWINVKNLAFGQIRALGLLHVTYRAPDVVLLEAFETGLHYDLAVTMLEFLTELQSFIILETHLALLVKAAMKRGWTVYYVNEGKFTKIRRLDDLRQIALQEANAYVFA